MKTSNFVWSKFFGRYVWDGIELNLKAPGRRWKLKAWHRKRAEERRAEQF